MIKTLIVIAVTAYFIGGVFIFKEWYRYYLDLHKDPDMTLVKIVAVGIIPLWLFLIIIIWYINIQDSIIRFLKKLAERV